MGITVSHTNYAPLSLVSTILGFVSFTFTLATLLKVFWSNLGTFGAAPEEIQDYLSNLKQGLLEERRHLRRVRRRLKSVKRDTSHGRGARSDSDDAGGGVHYSDGYRGNGGRKRSKRRRSSGEARGGGKRGPRHFDRTIQSLRSAGEDEALSVMRTTILDLIKTFRAIEQPFLKPEYRTQDSAHWSTNTPSPYPPEKTAYSYSDDDAFSAQHLHSTHRFGHEYRKCGFKERWLWVRRKAAVVNLQQMLSRVEVRRTAHEVGEVLSIVCNVGRDVEDLRSALEGVEGRLSRVMGVRRVD